MVGFSNKHHSSLIGRKLLLIKEDLGTVSYRQLKKNRPFFLRWFNKFPRLYQLITLVNTAGEFDKVSTLIQELCVDKSKA